MFCIKITPKGKTRSYFLSSAGCMNRLRIHAVQFESEERAKKVAEEINNGNPEFKAVVKPLWNPTKKAAAIAAVIVVIAGSIHAESKYFCKAQHLGPGSVAVSCMNGADPTVAGNVGGALIVSCGR